MHPADSRRSRRALLRSTSLIGLAALSPRTFADVAADLDVGGMPYAAFDHMATEVVELGDARILVAFGPGALTASRDSVIDYVRQSARSVAAYFGRFPARSTRLLILSSDSPGRPVRSGTAFGYRGAAIKLTLSSTASPADLARDWILVHEMCHLALPSLPRRQHWFEEGMASYVEPLARAQANALSPGRVWADFIKGMPQGLPQSGDRGLDLTPTWGRTYWGGALFCLVADVRTREATGNTRGLQHALRGILRHGNIEQDASLAPLLRAGDRETGVDVLETLYTQMKDSPYPVDLDRLWASLGLRAVADGVAFDDTAPLASIRQALTRPIGL